MGIGTFCQHDHLEIRDGSSSSDNPFIPLEMCGEFSDYTITASTSDGILITLISDSQADTSVNRGFLVSYTAVDNPGIMP